MVRVAGALLLALALVGATGTAAATPVATSSATVVRDPAIGPHAAEEARHRADVVPFAPIAGGSGRGAQLLQVSSATAGTSREVFGFAPYWALNQRGSWNYSVLTTLAYFGLDVNGDGSIATGTSGYQHWVGDANLPLMINTAHAAGDRVVLVAKQFDQATICSIVMSNAITQTAIGQILNAVASRGLDGVNVDFEGSSTPGCSPTADFPGIQAGFTNFMTALTAQVHGRFVNSEVSVDTYSGSASWDQGIFNITQLGAVVDFMFVMDYDMYPNDPGHAAPNAPINGGPYNDALSVRQYVGKAPASKVVLGVPWYGYKWSVTGPVQYAAATSGPEAVTYAGIQADFGCAQRLQRSWDYTAQSPWATWYSPALRDPCGANRGSWRELFYDDATSLGIKFDLVNGYRLGGAGVWALGYDGGAPELWSSLAQLNGAWPGAFHPLIPQRILDTRFGLGYPGAVGPGQSIDVQVMGVGGVPSQGAVAVVLNATVTQPTAPGYLTVYPTGSGMPPASNLNFTTGQTVANLVTSALGSGGRVRLSVAGAWTHVLLDVAGWIAAPAASTGPAGRFHPLQPARLLDTRRSGQPVGANRSITLQVTGQGGVPASGVSAVVLNLTVTNPTMTSYLTAYPTESSRPAASNLNFVAGQTVPNRAMIDLGPSGRITLYNAAGQADVVVDVNGWFGDASAPASTGGRLTAISPTRIVDTRLHVGAAASLGAGGTIAVAVAGIASVPAIDAPSPPSAVILNVTVTNPTAPSNLIVFPGAATRPGTSDLNFTAGQTVANLVVVQVGADGAIDVFNFAGAADVLVDVLGWYD